MLLHIPETAERELKVRYLDGNGCGDGSVYLTVEGEARMVLFSDDDTWGRPHLLLNAAVELYNAVIDEAAQALVRDPALKVLDLGQIECDLLTSRFEGLWTGQGYIQPAEDGSW